MEKLSISYFRELLDKNVAELKSYCKEWESLCTDVSIPEEVRDEIRTTIGLTNLLMRQKLKQFGGLIDDSEFKRSEKEITCIDLQGFWDMVYSEVVKIQKKFENLEKCQKNNWVFIEEAINKTEPKKKPTLAALAKVTVDSKARAMAARQRLAEAKLKMKAQLTNKCQKPLEVEILSTTKESTQKSAADKMEVSKVALGKKIIGEEHSPPKRTMKNVKNLYISEECEDSLPVKPAKSPKKSSSLEEISKNPKKQRSVRKATRKNGKENLYVNKEECPNSKPQSITDGKPADLPKLGKRGSAKNVPPLRCVTRSITKALLAEQQASKK